MRKLPLLPAAGSPPALGRPCRAPGESFGLLQVLLLVLPSAAGAEMAASRCWLRRAACTKEAARQTWQPDVQIVAECLLRLRATSPSR